MTEHESLLADALRLVLVRAGVLRPTAAPDGPQLLVAAADYCHGRSEYATAYGRLIAAVTELVCALSGKAPGVDVEASRLAVARAMVDCERWWFKTKGDPPPIVE